MLGDCGLVPWIEGLPVVTIGGDMGTGVDCRLWAKRANSSFDLGDAVQLTHS